MTPTATATARQRFEHRLAGPRRTHHRRALAALLTVTLVLTAVWLVYFSPVLTVHRVEVSGLTGTSRAAVVQIARAQIGTPMATVDVGAIVTAVKARSEIAEVAVHRSWPSTLTIRAVVRSPVLVLKSPNGTMRVVDAEGVVFANVSKAPVGVPVVGIPSSGTVSPDAVRAVLGIIRVLPDAMRPRMGKLTVSSADRVTFSIGATSIIWGTAGQEELKLRIVQALLPTKPGVIDVSAPDTPITRAA
ncbi:MAG: cell division protein FtsQ/DivIB [Nostocoides sp.]